MKIVYVYGNMSRYDHGLSRLVERTKNIFAELEADTEVIDLGGIHPPYCDGEATGAVDSAMEKIKAADGVVLACTAQFFAPTALMQCFLEYLALPEYAAAFENKYCMLAALSRAGGEKSALEYLARVVWHLGGFVAAEIGLQERHLAELEDGRTAAFVDRTAEDFYRAARQKRHYVIPRDYAPARQDAPAAAPVKTEAAPAPAAGGMPADAPHVDILTPEHEKEIEELSRLFSQKYNGSENDNPAEYPPAAEPVPKPVVSSSAAKAAVLATEASSDTAASTHRGKTAQQITQSLPHYFQPQLSAGLQAVIQISITGDEEFDGFLYIHSTECTYTEGAAPAPDVTIIADTATWQDVLKGKNTAQKAFMVGGLKVRGDFVLLTKFDSLFKLP